ncbi:MAG: lysophospholipid acyltransferase family protein [Nitrospirae bacterium]|nr:lysophospholipid acyltransferase family protein [Nitrospirota bacterium]
MIVRESIARDVLRLVIWYPFRWFLRLVPVVRAYTLLGFMGDVEYVLSSGRKKSLLLANLKRGLGTVDRSEGEFAGIIRRYLRNHYINQLQIFIFPRLNSSNLTSVHIFEGIEHLDDSLKRKRGSILLHSHFGPTQLPLHALGILGYQAVQVGLPTADGLSLIGRHVSFRLRVRYEAKIRARIVPATSFLRPLFEALKNNGVVFMTGDGAGGNKFLGKVSVEEFLGGKAPFTLGANILSDKTGAAVLPMFTIPEGSGYKTIIHPPVTSGAEGWARMDGFAGLLESYIKRYPYLWHFWDEYDKRTVS